MGKKMCMIFHAIREMKHYIFFTRTVEINSISWFLEMTSRKDMYTIYNTSIGYS